MRTGVSRRVMALVAVLAAVVPSTLPAPAIGQVPPPAPEPAEQPGAMVRIPFPRDDGALTPYSFQLGYPLLTLVYDTLLWRDTDGVPRPWLARALETNPEATRFTLRLAPNAQWHDGRPVTAEDVRFTFRHVASHPSPRFTAEVAEVANVTAPDPATVVITTKRPSPGFVDQTLADLPILPAHLWQSLPAGQTSPPGLPVGSGPYRLVERLEGGGYRFQANAGYWKGAPTVRQIDVPIMNDLGAILTSFRNRNVDLIPLRLPPDEAKSVDNITSRVARGPSYWGVQLVFNMRRPPFDDLKLRQAVTKAIDLALLARIVGDAVPADQGMLHPESPWAPGQTLKVTDEPAAKVELAGLAAQGFEVVSADNDPVHIEAARQVAEALRRAGLQATSTTRSVADMNRALGIEGSSPDFTLAVTGTAPTASYDPDYLNRLFGSGTATTSGYSSPSFDQLARRVATTVDPAARRAAVTQELQLLASDLPALPLVFPNGAFAYRPSAYEGWQYVRGIGVLDKQSFLPAAEQPAPTTTTAAPAEAASPPSIASPGDDGGGGFPLGVLALGLAAAALAVIGVAIFRRR